MTHIVSLTDIATYGSVWMILPHTVQFDWYWDIPASLNDLPHIVQFDDIDSLTDIAT